MDQADANLLVQNEPVIESSTFNTLTCRRVSIPASSDTYDTDNSHLGIALIFNHRHFADQFHLPESRGKWDRPGTEVDFERLGLALKAYGFDVRAYEDLTYSQIVGVLEAVSKEDHSDNDCLFVAVMTHGLSGKLCAFNKDYPVETLWEMFLGSSCKSLIGKPKLFFIQACRGQKVDVGVQFSGFTTMSRDAIDSKGHQVTYTIPSTADLLVMYSTFDENLSWRNPLSGSWFIQSLCIELENALNSKQPMELYKMLTAVSRRVAYEYQSNVPDKRHLDEMKEMPNFVSTLTKMFFIKAKHN